MTKDILDFMNDWARRKPSKRNSDGKEEPMVIFTEAPIYSEELPEDIKEVADLIKERHRIDDYLSLRDKVIDEDMADPSAEIPEELILDQFSEQKRKIEDISDNLLESASKTNHQHLILSFPDFGSTPFVSNPRSNMKQSTGKASESLPAIDLNSRLESISKEYSEHLDPGAIRRSS